MTLGKLQNLLWNHHWWSMILRIFHYNQIMSDIYLNIVVKSCNLIMCWVIWRPEIHIKNWKLLRRKLNWDGHWFIGDCFIINWIVIDSNFQIALSSFRKVNSNIREIFSINFFIKSDIDFTCNFCILCNTWSIWLNCWIRISFKRIVRQIVSCTNTWHCK